MSSLFTPYKLGPVTLRNRTIRSAAFEAMCKDNRPTDSLYNYHLSVARGGIGMTTLAYPAVCRSGLSFNTQLLMCDEIIPDLRRITDAIHKENAAASIQIGHCGNMTHRSTCGQMPISASNGFNLYSPSIVRRMKKSEIYDVIKSFGEATHIAYEAGFDCVEIHAGHSYLLSQFMSDRLNHRKDEFGGSFDNRIRFAKLALEECLNAAQGKIAVILKMNMRDGCRRGMDIDESIELAKVFQKTGADGIVLSGGCVNITPMYVMRGKMPIRSFTYSMPQWWLKLGIRMFGNVMIKPYPYKDLYFLEDAMRFRKELPDMNLIYVGGVSSRESADKIIDSGFQLLQMARSLVCEPDFVNKMQNDAHYVSKCEHANHCVASIYNRCMICHQNETEPLPASITKEINRIVRENQKA